MGWSERDSSVVITPLYPFSLLSRLSLHLFSGPVDTEEAEKRAAQGLDNEHGFPVCHLLLIICEGLPECWGWVILSQKESRDLWAICAINSGEEIVAQGPGIIHSPKN